MTTATQTAATDSSQTISLLDQAVAATKHTEPDQARELLKTLTSHALDGTITWDKNMVRTISNTIERIDETISTQLAHVMHSDSFKKLEGSWRGLEHLIKHTPTSNQLKIKLLNLPKKIK